MVMMMVMNRSVWLGCWAGGSAAAAVAAVMVGLVEDGMWLVGEMQESLIGSGWEKL